MVARIKKNDSVIVISGKDKGKKGTVIQVSPDKGKVMVKGVAVVTKHVKARRQGETGGIKQKEGLIDVSKVMPVCTSCKKACRIHMKFLEDATKARACTRCKEIF